jgi:hypothetical protein
LVSPQVGAEVLELLGAFEFSFEVPAVGVRVGVGVGVGAKADSPEYLMIKPLSPAKRPLKLTLLPKLN